MTDDTTNLPGPDPRLRADLIRGIGHYERRRRRTAAGGVLVAVTAASSLVLLNRDGEGHGPVTTAPPTSTTSIEQNGDAPVEVARLDVPVTLLASNVNGGAVAVADLGRGQVVVVGQGNHEAGGPGYGAVSAAAFGPNALFGGVVPSRYEVGPGDPIPDVVGGALRRPAPLPDLGRQIRQGMPTDEGDAVWLLSRPEGATTSQVWLVDRDGQVVVDVEVAAGSLAAVLGDAAVVQLGDDEGGAVAIVRPDGTVERREAPPGASVPTVADGRIVWLVDDEPSWGDVELHVVVDGGTEFRLPAPEGQRWVGIGGPTIPSEGPPFKRVTSDGSTLLMALQRSVEVTHGETVALVTVDLDTGVVVRTMPVDGNVVTAFWSDDDSRIVVVTRDVMPDDQVQERISTIDPHDPDAQVVGPFDVFPPGFYVIAAR